jgi:glycosyltransferase involved in cell wall biosynthesis
MSNIPFFSIVSISFNQVAFLPTLLDSVVNQGYSNYEHIIVDPGSSDGSRKLLLDYRAPCTLIFEKDSGPSDGLNKGFKAAKGRYVLFINSDDFLLPGSLQLIENRLQQLLSPDILFFGGYIQRSDVWQSRKYITPGSSNGLVQALGLSHFYQQGCVLKASVFRNTSGFNADNFTCWDAEFFLQIFAGRHLRICRAKEPIAVFVIHLNSISGSGIAQAQYLKDMNAAVSQYYGKYILALRRLILLMPSGLVVFVKYLLDPWMFFWRLYAFLFCHRSNKP